MGNDVWFDAQTNLDCTPQQRGVGYLFQQPMLFPHQTVYQNVAFGLCHQPRSEREKRVRELADLLGFEPLLQRRPQELSGGQQQRVALARALAIRPRLLLLDEPFSALDSPARAELRPMVREVVRQFGIPSVIVTHSRTEAMALADDIAVLDATGLLQVGPAVELFTRPASSAVARIVGVESLQPGIVVQQDGAGVQVRVGSAVLQAIAVQPVPKHVLVSIRGEDVVLMVGEAVQSSARNQLVARVCAILPEGALIRVTLDAGFPLVALVTRPACEELQLQAGSQVLALIKAPAVHLIPHESPCLERSSHS
jgi:molybdate transport system ATP-binding protein